jgi:hypothetical protein
MIIVVMVKTLPVPINWDHLPLTGQVGHSSNSKAGRRKKKSEVVTTEKPAKLVIQRLEKLTRMTRFRGDLDFNEKNKTEMMKKQ